MNAKKLFALVALAALAACGGDEKAPDAPAQQSTSAARSNAPTAAWFICDGIDTPSIFVMAKSQDNSRVLVTEYAKSDGRPAWRADFALGEGEGAAGSIYTPLLRGSEQAGSVRQINSGNLENPGSAFTPVYTSLQFGDRNISCRWIARTRFIGFDERRTFVVHEDPDGDLIYSTYDFSAASAQTPIDLGENSRTTAFSVEVRGGSETTGPGGSEYRFENGDILYLVTVANDRAATVEVWRGDNQIQSEVMIAQQSGTGE